MKYIKYYQTLAEYNSDEKVRPNVSYIAELDELRYLGDWIIPIEDATLKAILVENFDTDGDGEISREEALAVTEPFPSLILYCEAVDLTALKYFKNVRYSGDITALFRYADITKPNTWDKISFDGCDFSGATTMRQFYSNRKLTNVSMRNCDFRNALNWQGFCPSPGTRKDLVVDFSYSKFPDASQIVNAAQFIYNAKTYKFILDGCDSTALNTMKYLAGYSYVSGHSGNITIDIDGIRWTLTGATPNQEWVSSEIVE